MLPGTARGDQMSDQNESFFLHVGCVIDCCLGAFDELAYYACLAAE